MCIFTPALSKTTLANACDLKVKQPNGLGARYYCLVVVVVVVGAELEEDGDKQNNLPVFSSP